MHNYNTTKKSITIKIYWTDFMVLLYLLFQYLRDQ